MDGIELSHHFFGFICCFYHFSIWLIPKLWYLIKVVLLKIGQFLGIVKKQSAISDSNLASGTETVNETVNQNLARLQQQPESGTQAEEESDGKRNQTQDKRAK